MRFSNGRLIYDGIHETFRGRAAFIEEALQYEPVQQRVAQCLAEDKALREKIGYTGTFMHNGVMMNIPLHEDALDLLWDILMKRIVTEQIKAGSDTLELGASPMIQPEFRIDLDFTFYLAYALIANRACLEKMREIMPKADEYHEYWQQSVYNDPDVECYISAEYLPVFREVIGIILKLQEEEYHGPVYQKFMTIVYAGNRFWKNRLKGRKILGGDEFRDLLIKEIPLLYNSFHLKSLAFLLLVIAEDMKIEIAWDYGMLQLLDLYDDIPRDIKQVDAAWKEMKQSQKKQESAYRNLIQKLDEDGAVHHSMTELVLNPTHSELGQLVMKIMHMFDLDPRKVEFYALTEEECQELFCQKEKWSQKTYAYSLIIAHLCKYIKKVEAWYLDMRDLADETLRVTERVHAFGKELLEYSDWEEYEKQQAELQRCQKEIAQLKGERKQLEEVILKQEKELEKEKKKAEEAEKQVQEHMQELAALRSFVYFLANEEEEEKNRIPDGDKKNESCKEAQTSADSEKSIKSKDKKAFDDDEKIRSWKEKKVVVVGGHVNWQAKLKELFPNWQFLLAGQSALAGNMIRGKEIIIFNTMILDHSCYYKVISEKGKEQKLCYVHSNNIEKCIKELASQMQQYNC